MSKLLRYVLTGAAIIIIAMWVFAVLRSCQESKMNDKTVNQSPTELNESKTPAESSSTDKKAGTETDDPGDIDYVDAVKSGSEGSEDDQDASESEELPSEMDNSSGRLLTEATAGSDNSPFLIIAGTYTSEGNAQSEVKRLQALGFEDAEVVQFIGSRYYSVCVDRLDQLSAARQLRNKVKAANTEEVYVHRRRLPKK